MAPVVFPYGRGSSGRGPLQNLRPGFPCLWVVPSSPPPATPYRAVGVLVVRRESWKSWLHVLTVAGPLIEVLCSTYCTDYYPAARTYSQAPPPSSRIAPSLQVGLPGTPCQPLAQHLVTSRRVLSWNKSVELPEGGLVPAISAPRPPFPIPHSHTHTEARRDEG